MSLGNKELNRDNQLFSISPSSLKGNNRREHPPLPYRSSVWDRDRKELRIDWNEFRENYYYNAITHKNVVLGEKYTGSKPELKNLSGDRMFMFRSPKFSQSWPPISQNRVAHPAKVFSEEQLDKFQMGLGDFSVTKDVSLALKPGSSLDNHAEIQLSLQGCQATFRVDATCLIMAETLVRENGNYTDNYNWILAATKKHDSASSVSKFNIILEDMKLSTTMYYYNSSKDRIDAGLWIQKSRNPFAA